MSDGAVDTDALVAAGLYDPDAADASERLQLLEYLLAQGVSIDELVAADRRGSIFSAGLDALMWPDGRGLTVGQVAAAAGMPVETARRARRLLGLTDPGDEPACHAEEIDLLRALNRAVELFGEENALQFARVLGTSTASLAEAAISTFTASVTRSMRDAGASPAEYAKQVREATLGFVAARNAVDIALRLQFEESLDRLTTGWAELDAEPSDEVEFTVCFVDLVESTRLTLEQNVTAFAADVRDFEGLAAEAAASHGARLVKLIGDSAMIAGPLPVSVATAAREVVMRVADDARFRGAHGGIASGRVVARGGDYLGTPVVLAARLTEVSRAGEILCDAPTAQSLGDISMPAGDRVLRGFDEPQPVWTVRI
jgi:class 3 adenylate cyclase